jgi:hypothetical protein
MLIKSIYTKIRKCGPHNKTMSKISPVLKTKGENTQSNAFFTDPVNYTNICTLTPLHLENYPVSHQRICGAWVERGKDIINIYNDGINAMVLIFSKYLLINLKTVYSQSTGP